MPKTSRLVRPPVRALSDSENEEDSSSYSNGVNRRRTRASEYSQVNHANERLSSDGAVQSSSNHVNTKTLSQSTQFQSSVGVSSATINNSKSTAFNQRNFTTSSLHLNTSAVQSSTFDKIRWIVWRFIYIQIIRCINFDVWLLSRLRGSYKAVFILLLPLILYLIFGPLFRETPVISIPLDIISSSFVSASSAITSVFSAYYPYSKESEGSDTSRGVINTAVSYFPSLPAFFSFSFFKPETSTSFYTAPAPDSNFKLSEDYLKKESNSKAIQVLEQRINELTQKIAAFDSRATDNKNVKDKNVEVFKAEVSGLQSQFQSLSTIIKQIQKDVQKVEESASSKASGSLAEEHTLLFNSINSKLHNFETQLQSLGALNKCCDEKWTASDFTASLESHLMSAFKNVMSGDKRSPYHNFNEWLDSKYTDSNKLSVEINAALDKLKTQKSGDPKLDAATLDVIKGVVQQYLTTLKVDTSSKLSVKATGYSLSTEEIKRIVRDALMLYDADKTGQGDYALESSGGSVIGTRCSESYVEKNGKFNVWGWLPLGSYEVSPRTAIQPDMQPGKCWAFKGSQGFLVIQLAYTIHPTGFTVEHIPVSISPTGSIDSAPKDFSVWGLSSEADTEGVLLGSYTYDKNGEPLQYFPIQSLTKEAFAVVELKINSNHGRIEFTCLYRFRVHGTRATHL